MATIKPKVNQRPPFGADARDADNNSFYLLSPVMCQALS